jgi:endonuclease/exonuclease/phosphatase family metal-dependent hydrolase
MILKSRTLGASTVLLFSCFSGVPACQFSSPSRVQSDHVSAVPEGKNLFQLEAHSLEASPAIESLLLSPENESHKNGLSIAYHLSTTQTGAQLLGLMTTPLLVPFTVTAQTHDARRITCTKTTADSPMAQLQEKFMSVSCGTHSVTWKLSLRPVSLENLAEVHLLKALSSGATLSLHSAKGTIDVTLSSNRVTLSSKTTSRTFAVPPFQRNEFITRRQPLSLLSGNSMNCVGSCADLTHDFQLERSENGGLQLRTSGRNDDENVFRFSSFDHVRVSSYNVENFWDDTPDNSRPYDDFSASLSNWYSDNMAVKKSARISEALLAAGLPDIVGLQEIESAENNSRSLEILKHDLTRLGYNYYALGQQAQDNPTAVTTAFVSKYPLLENERIDFLFKDSSLPEEKLKDFTDASRDPQRVTLNLPHQRTLTLVNSHWKSKRDKSPVGDVMRKSIATALREHLLALEKASGRAISALLLGDFNSDYREAPVQEGLALSTSLAEARNNANTLFPLWMTLPPAEQGSYPHDSHLQALDNIIINQTLLSSGEFALAGPLRVVGKNQSATSVLLNGDGLPLRSQLRKYKDSNDQIRTIHFNEGFSDHLPLVAEFRYGLGPVNEAYRFAPAIETQTIAALPTVENQGSACLEGESQRQTPETLRSTPRGSCVLLDGIALTLQKTGLHNMAFVVNSTHESGGSFKVIVTADRAFGANKGWLRGSLQTSEGKTLVRLRGHMGLVEGNLALFIHDPKTDISLQ